MPFYAGIDDADIGGRGIRWQDDPSRRERPEPAGRPRPGSPDTEPEAPTRDRGARRVPPSGVRRPGARDALALGTYRDLWAGPITELNPPLKFLTPQQRVEISPADAERLGLKPATRSASPRTAPASRPRSRSRSGSPRASCFLAEGVADGNANALLNGGPVQVEIEKLSEVRA